MSGVADMSRGLRSIGAIKLALAKGTPLAIADATATEVAAVLSVKVRAEFDAGETVYEESRPLGVEGNKLSLVSGGLLPNYTKKKPHRSRNIYAKRGTGTAQPSSGHVRDSIGFVANGRIVRARLAQRYAKYLVGKYKILPHEQAAIPQSWQRDVREVFTRHYDKWAAENGMQPIGGGK